MLVDVLSLGPVVRLLALGTSFELDMLWMGLEAPLGPLGRWAYMTLTFVASAPLFVPRLPTG